MLCFFFQWQGVIVTCWKMLSHRELYSEAFFKRKTHYVSLHQGCLEVVEVDCWYKESHHTREQRLKREVMLVTWYEDRIVWGFFSFFLHSVCHSPWFNCWTAKRKASFKTRRVSAIQHESAENYSDTSHWFEKLLSWFSATLSSSSQILKILLSEPPHDLKSKSATQSKPIKLLNKYIYYVNLKVYIHFLYYSLVHDWRYRKFKLLPTVETWI